jgi:hypothetical protein
MMNDAVLVDGLPSIELEVAVDKQHGRLYLSQIYGSYEKIFEGVEDVPDAVVQCSCPACHNLLPIVKTCTYKAPVASVNLEMGGSVNFCTRNGCRAHSLEFENSDDAFKLFLDRDESRYL